MNKNACLCGRKFLYGGIGASLSLLVCCWIWHCHMVSAHQIQQDILHAKTLLKNVRASLKSQNRTPYHKINDQIENIEKNHLNNHIKNHSMELALRKKQFWLMEMTTLGFCGYFCLVMLKKFKSDTNDLEEINAKVQFINVRRGDESRLLKAPPLFDYLTKVASRTGFEWAIKREFLRARSMNLPLTVAFIDIDGFKKFNQTHGYERGNHVLQSVADIIQEFLRETDVVARYYGDAFAVILFDTSGDQALKIMEAIRIAIESRLNSDITVSIGISVFRPSMQSQHELRAHAHRAQNMIKHMGGDGIKIA